jgi:lipopolysaccharide export LptBFGC system permease protein LptF
MISMLYALLAIALMFLANLLIISARRREKGWVRTLMSVCAYLLLPPIFLFALIALL